MKQNPLKLFILCCIFLSIFPHSSSAAETTPKLYSDKAISIIADTGEVVYSKKGTAQDYPASTTKIMTGLLLVEKLKPTDTITMTNRSLKEERNNNQIIFKAGEKINRDEALKILMINSNNELAYAIGERISGNMVNFSKLMNNRAKELGAKNTNFVTPNGLPNSNHKTTAYDLAMITRGALKQPVLIKSMGMKSAYVNTSRQKHILVKKTSLIYDKANFIAAKTGYTKAAGNTLVEISEKNGIKIINVVLRSKKDKYVNDIKLLDSYAYSKIKNVKIIDKSTWNTTFSILNQQVDGIPRQDVMIPTALSKESFQTKIIPTIYADDVLLKNGLFPSQKVGQLEVFYQNNPLKSIDLLCTSQYVFTNPNSDSSTVTALK